MQIDAVLARAFAEPYAKDKDPKVRRVVIHTASGKIHAANPKYYSTVPNAVHGADQYADRFPQVFVDAACLLDAAKNAAKDTAVVITPGEIDSDDEQQQCKISFTRKSGGNGITTSYAPTRADNDPDALFSGEHTMARCWVNILTTVVENVVKTAKRLKADHMWLSVPLEWYRHPGEGDGKSERWVLRGSAEDDETMQYAYPVFALPTPTEGKDDNVEIVAAYNRQELPKLSVLAQIKGDSPWRRSDDGNRPRTCCSNCSPQTSQDAPQAPQASGAVTQQTEPQSASGTQHPALLEAIRDAVSEHPDLLDLLIQAMEEKENVHRAVNRAIEEHL